MGETIDVLLRAHMQAGDVISGVGDIQKALSGLTIPKDISTNLEKSFSKLGPLIKDYQKQINKGFTSQKDVKNLNLLKEKIDSTFGEIKGQISNINGQEIRLKVDTQQIDELSNKMTKMQADLSTAMQKVFKSNQSSTSIETNLSKLENAIPKNWTKVTGMLQKASGAFKVGEYAEFNRQITTTLNYIEKLGNTSQIDLAHKLGMSEAKKELADAQTYFNSFFNKLKTDIRAANTIEQLRQSLSEMGTELQNLELSSIEEGPKAFEDWKNSILGTENALNQLHNETEETAGGMARMSEEINQLKSSTQYFFSLRNMINLLKRGVDEAIESVKELDAAMTETAVVTDYSVGDMWKKLPEYTANANALGASVKDMYEATTLYYQQGLNTEQSMSIAAETMKMARIGGLEAADATDKMTAALRGFNMEINETSAQRVNDVYSNLAAKTASNTEELGTAMQRTASIAASAGMSFEGTAAFLAQAIETTREPAENLGTAMKTIVARFTELKKNPLEITEVDGEEVSYNKIDTALQSIGVSLKDANGQFRNLDDVFLDISQRWNSLTQTQQRYIATTAAGSRQQSRFIAMMSNYDRTVQLMDYANNSAGASNEQFGKTMESLEAKLNKLHNAWQQFEMGIADNTIIKGAVDGLTGLLGLVNKLLDTLSFGSSGVKSVLSIFTAFTGLKMAGRFANSLIGGLGGMLDPTSSFGKGFFSSGKGAAGEGGIAGKISSPIVAKLNELIVVTKGQNNINKAKITSTVDEYNNAMKMLRSSALGNMGKISEARSVFSNLSNEHAYAAYRNAPGTIDAIKQSAMGWLGSKNMSTDAKKVGQQLMSSIFKGMQKKEISIKDGMNLIGKPQQWGQYFGTDVAQNFSNAFSKELATQAHKTALQNMGWDADKFSFQSKAFKDLMLNENQRLAYVERFKKAMAEVQTEAGSIDNVPINVTKYQQLANNVGIVGSKFTSAGMSIQIFGSQLSQLSPALQGIGSLLTQVGMAINTFGMGISGVGGAITKITGRVATAGAAAKAASAAGLTAKTTANVFLGTLTEGLSAGAVGGIIGVALVGGILLAKSIITKKAKEAGQEIRDNFEKGFTEKGNTIDSIESYKDRFNELARGVDQFGHNVDLSDEDYKEYLSISQELSQLSPSLIAGYNAEGQAILRKADAIDEVINKLKEEQQLALDTYTSDESLDKLIKAFRTTDAYKENHKTLAGPSRQDMGQTSIGAFDTEKSNISQAIKKANLEWSDFSQILTDLGIGSAQSINELSARQLKLISDHYTDIINKVKEFNPELEDTAEDGLKEAFSGVNDSIENILSEGEPIVTALQQWMGQEKLDAVGLQLGDEFVAGFNSGVQGLMLKGLTEDWKPEQYRKELRTYAEEWKNLTGPTSEYTRTLEEADKVQQEYLNHIGEDGAIEEYKQDIEESAQKLEELADSTDTATEAGQVFAEQCIAQANTLRNYATEGAITLSEALNTLSDEFDSARGAKERFDEAIKGGDYYTAAEGYKEIIDTVLDEKNVSGDGSLTGWAGAEELLGQKYVDTHNWQEIVSQIKKVQDCFADGADGVLAFNDLLVDNADKLEGLGHVVDGNDWEFDLQNEDLAEYAELLGMSEDALAALIDKARQWVPMDLGNPAQIRQALEQGQQSMIGQAQAGGKSNLYTSEAAFRAEARQQGIRGEDYAQTKSDLEQTQNVKFLTVENLTDKSAKDYIDPTSILNDIGISEKEGNNTLNNVVAAFSKMGFDLEDTKQILSSSGIKLQDGQLTDEQIEKAYQKQAYATENPTIAGIADKTGIIADAATAILASMGIVSESLQNSINTATNQDNINGLLDGLSIDNVESYQAGRDRIQSQIDDNNATISLLTQGRDKAGANTTQGQQIQAQINALTAANEQLQQGLDTNAAQWQDKLSQYTEAFSNITDNVQDQKFIDSNAMQFTEAMSNTDIMVAANALRQLSDEGNLSYTTMRTLAAQFMQFRQGDLMNLDSSELDKLCTKLGLTKDEATSLLNELHNPFILTGRLEGADLENYINQINALDDTDKNILLNVDTTGEEKATALIDKINEEFGDGSEETKSIIIQATTALANGDEQGAQKLLQEAGFDPSTAQTITQKLSVLVDGSVANPDEVKASLQSQLNDLGTIDMQVKANISANIGKIGTKVDTDTSSIDDAKKKADKTKSTIKVDADTKKAEEKIDDLKKAKKTTITVNAKKGTGWVQTMTINTDKKARGQNYSIPAHKTISFGSAAGGMNIPKAKTSSKPQMTALVGEEGFEVGYIPSEARSVIFGANGPEMTSFPKDTIIYPHKQSLDIVRRGKRGIPTFGSFEYGKDTVKSKGLRSSVTKKTGGKSSTSTSKKKNKKSKKSSDSESKAAKKLFEKVNVWWDNFSRRAEARQRTMDAAAKAFEKSLKGMSGTAKNAQKTLAEYQKSIQAVKDENQQGLNKANEQLANLDAGKGDESKAIVSYSVTKTKGKGKKKKTTTESKQKEINLGGYIKNINGVYQVDQAALDSVKNEELRKAIADAANQRLNDLQGKANNAADAIAKAEEELSKAADTMYETFYSWEKSINEVYALSKHLELLSGLKDFSSGLIDLEEALMTAGMRSLEEGQKNIAEALTEQQNKLSQQIENTKILAQARQKELEQALSLNTYLEVLNKSTKANNGVVSDEAQEDYQAAAEAIRLFNEFGGDFSQIQSAAIENFNNKDYNKTFYDKIQKNLDNIYSKQSEAIKTNSDITNLTKEITELTNQMDETIINFQKDMLEGVQKRAEEEIKRLDKLNDSLSKAFKDLIDEVKRKLDERRQAEDNAKTESDIARKQQRLAALRADTSGGNQVEIAQLEKEIADAQQDYQRSLEDQLLDKLQQQADEAEKQRQRQIELQEAANEIATQTGLTMKQIEEWMREARGGDEEAVQKLREAYRQSHGYYDENTSEREKARIDNDFNKEYGLASTYIEKEDEAKQLIKENIGNNEVTEGNVNKVEKTIPDQEESKKAIQESAKKDLDEAFANYKFNEQDTVDAYNNAYKYAETVGVDVSEYDIETKHKQQEAEAAAAAEAARKAEEERKAAAARQAAFDTAKKNYDSYMAARKKAKKLSGAQVDELIRLGGLINKGPRTVLNEIVGGKGADPFSWENTMKALLDSNRITRWNLAATYGDGSTAVKYLFEYLKINTQKKKNAFWKEFKTKNPGALAYNTGGLAPYTGPAWLDGTPSKPELVLNAADTKNFIALKDILSKAMSSTSSISDTSYGDMTYEININVEKLTSDYDVDKVAERVKKIIVKDSSYRNVTQVRRLR